MRRLTLLSGLVFLAITLATNSCDRKSRGCTDPDSINFDEFAEKDDGSCRYEGYAVIWYGEEASLGLVEDGAVALTFYLDGEVVGSSNAGVFWAEEPECGEDGSVSITEDLGRDKIKGYILSVKDQDDFEYWNTTIELEGNTCLALELTWASRKRK